MADHEGLLQLRIRYLKEITEKLESLTEKSYRPPSPEFFNQFDFHLATLSDDLAQFKLNSEFQDPKRTVLISRMKQIQEEAEQIENYRPGLFQGVLSSLKSKILEAYPRSWIHEAMGCIKKAYELLLDVLVYHAGCMKYDEIQIFPVAEKINRLKSIFEPPTKINRFWNLKEAMNVIHEKEISLAKLEEALFFFYLVLAEAKELLQKPVARLNLTGVKITQSIKYKTILCKHYQRGNCLEAENCQFAHSHGELNQ